MRVLRFLLFLLVSILFIDEVYNEKKQTEYSLRQW